MHQDVNRESAIKNVLMKIKSIDDVVMEVPGLKGKLEKHQRVGVAYLVAVKKGLCLDFVGAGKTVETIAADLILRNIGEVRRTLIVCLSSGKEHWARNYKQFSDLTTYVIDGSKKLRQSGWMSAQGDVGVTIAHYEAVRSDIPSMISGGMVFDWDLVVWDEASYFKSYDTVLAGSLRLLVDHVNPSCIFALSATPIQKRLEDLWCIMEKVRPGLLGADFYDFQERHVIRKLIKTTSRRGRHQQFWKVVGYRGVEEVAEMVEPYFIRRNRDDVYGDKIKRMEQDRYVDLSPQQQRAYRDVRNRVQQGKQSTFQAFAEMEKIVDTMQWFDPANDTSSKIDDLMFLLENELVDEKVVVFSKFKVPLYHISGRLTKRGIQHTFYSGDVVDREERERNRQRFQNDPEVKVILVTHAAEMCIEFHSARYMVFLNKIYNFARMEQLKGRIDRPVVQRSNFVCYINYVSKGTHEDRLKERMEKEKGLFEDIFGESGMELKLSEDQLFKLIMEGVV